MKGCTKVLLLVTVSILGSCEREERAFSPPPESEAQVVALSPISPGATAPVIVPAPNAKEYEENAYHLNEGKRLYDQFNCKGCHGNGGGGSGPALMDGRWIYGGNIENIVSTIREGRPNGMPSFRGRIPDTLIWQLAAYVKSLSGNIREDVRPSRNDDISSHSPENRLPTLPPGNSGQTSPGATPQ